MTFSRVLIVLSAAAASVLLSGCVEPQVHVGDDFGVAIHQDVMAQIADPQPAYLNKPAPPSDGVHTAAATERYRTGRVIQPVSAEASSIGASMGGSGGSGGSGASAGAGPAPQ
jgi:hypothetical protein